MRAGSCLQGIQQLFSHTLGLHLQQVPITAHDYTLIAGQHVTTPTQNPHANTAHENQNQATQTQYSGQGIGVEGSFLTGDVLLKFEVHRSSPGRDNEPHASRPSHADEMKGILYLHVHSNMAEYPFTSLMSYGTINADTECVDQVPVVLLRMPLPYDESIGLNADELGVQISEVPSNQTAGAQGSNEFDSTCYDVMQQYRLMEACRLKHRFTDPLHLSMLLHELGHALQYILTSATPTIGSFSSASNSTATSITPHEPLKEKDLSVPDPSTYLRSATHWSIEWREAAAHLVERWAREPASLQLLSCHARLGNALTPLDAGRCAHLVAVASLPGRYLEYAEQIRSSLAEQYVYGNAAVCQVDSSLDQRQPSSTPHSLSSYLKSTSKVLRTTDASVDCKAGMLPVDLHTLHDLEQHAVLGGSGTVYVIARLMAAATWRKWLEHDVLHPCGGQGIRDLLLAAPAWSFESVDAAVTTLLQDSKAFMQLQGTIVVDGVNVGFTSVTDEGCLIPDLAAECWQDIDIIG